VIASEKRMKKLCNYCRASRKRKDV